MVLLKIEQLFKWIVVVHSSVKTVELLMVLLSRLIVGLNKVRAGLVKTLRFWW